MEAAFCYMHSFCLQQLSSIMLSEKTDAMFQNMSQNSKNWMEAITWPK